MKQIQCRGCGSEKLHFLGKCRDFGQNGLRLFPDGIPEYAQGNLYLCADCGLGQRIPCLTKDELALLYASMQENQMSYEFETNGAWVNSRGLLKQEWKDTDTPSILDIGAYEGRFLQGLPEKWKKFAIEPSKKAKAVLKGKDIEVIGDFLENASSEWHDRLDCVCMFDVVEHLHNPSEGLLRALKFVKPGGIMLVSTGNMDAWTWRWFGPDHWYLETPLHMSFLSKRFFRLFCQREGVRLSAAYSIAHRTNNTKRKIDDFTSAWYFAFKKMGGGWRIPQRLIHSLPRYRNLMHKTTMISTFYLRDHILVEISKSQ